VWHIFLNFIIQERNNSKLNCREKSICLIAGCLLSFILSAQDVKYEDQTKDLPKINDVLRCAH